MKKNSDKVIDFTKFVRRKEPVPGQVRFHLFEEDLEEGDDFFEEEDFDEEDLEEEDFDEEDFDEEDFDEEDFDEEDYDEEDYDEEDFFFGAGGDLLDALQEMWEEARARDAEIMEKLVEGRSQEFREMGYSEEKIRQFRFNITTFFNGPFSLSDVQELPLDPLPPDFVFSLAHQGLLKVSEEEADGWYVRGEEELPSFEKLVDSCFLVPWGASPGIAQGSVRDACRLYREKVQAFFLSELKGQVTMTSWPSERDINIFTCACYFFSEFHVEEAFPLLIDWGFERSMYGVFPDEFVTEIFPSALYATFNGDFDYFFSFLQRTITPHVTPYERFLGQLCMDGVFPREQLFSIFEEECASGRLKGRGAQALATWALYTGIDEDYPEEMEKLFKLILGSFSMHDSDLQALKKGLRQTKELAGKNLVMDDAILYGLDPSKIHAPRQLRQRCIWEQKQRIEKWKAGRRGL